ncbi:hypothetical protein [Pedobacter caeni]|uniref:SMI1 / KNR4 family (SUKH-1) n=1 Tax=Pedobacter caeni TaxID=288992 RepID=A0A1M4U5I6_9SPHI|nr:hypothetical protein [Pedobacter caeni]SHE51933.1 hypothetical protein SAMN04488522_101437 [Pedobacter caeni]
MIDYKKLFKQLLSELNEVTDLEVITSEIGKGTAAAEFTDIENSFRMKLTKDIYEFYSQVGFVNIEWRFKKPLQLDEQEYVVDGKINILPLHDVFWGVDDLGWGNILWFDHMENATKQKMRKLRPFDFFDEEDNGCISFQRNETDVSPNLVLYSTDNGYYPLKLNIESYLKLLLQTKGISRWPFLLVKAPINENEIFMATMKTFLPLLFKNNKEYDLFMKNMNL